MKTLRDLLYTTLRFVGRHVTGFFGALAAFLTVGFFVSLAAISIFAALASAVTAGFTQQFDEVVLRWFAAHRTPMLDTAMLEITTLGTGLVLIVVILVASVFLWQTQHKWSVYVLLLGTIGGSVLNSLLKLHYNRPRPSIVEVAATVHTTSFPSGHSMSSLVAYGSVAYLVGRLGTTRTLTRTTWLLSALVIIAIGISRMYLGVHYPSDVIAGFMAGLAWLAFIASTVAAIQFYAERRPETRHEEHDLEK